MTLTKLILALACLMSGALVAQEAKVTELLSKDLTNLPGNKEGLMITVDYPPGSSDPVHRHNAHSFIYVLEGSIVMQVRGGKEVTLTPGQTFYEGPDDVHVVGRNASKTKPAKFVVFFVKDKGAPVLVPANYSELVKGPTLPSTWPSPTTIQPQRPVPYPLPVARAATEPCNLVGGLLHSTRSGTWDAASGCPDDLSYKWSIIRWW